MSSVARNWLEPDVARTLVSAAPRLISARVDVGHALACPKNRPLFRLLAAALLAATVSLAATDLRLMDAIKRRDHKGFAALLAAKADVNATQPDGATALAWASYLDDRESALSLLGLGIMEPQSSWGNMLHNAMDIVELNQHPWVLWPGFFIFLAVMAFNLVGDGLRDALDPRRLKT